MSRKSGRQDHRPGGSDDGAESSPPKTTRRAPEESSSEDGAPALAGSSRVTPAGGNVFADLGFPPGEAKNLKIRAQLMSEIHALIDASGLTQTQAASLFGVSQPRISDLVRGKIGLFTIDSLINMLASAGIAVRVEVAGRAA